MAKKTEAVEKKMTGKQRRLVKGIAEGKTQKQAALDAGYSPKTAESIVSHELKKPQLQAALRDLMEKHGLDDASLLTKHADLLNAQKTISAIGGKEANGGTVDFVDVPDHQVQVKALELAYKLKGAFTEKHEFTGKNGEPFIFNFQLVPGPDKE